MAIRRLFFQMPYFSANRHLFPPIPKKYSVIPSACEGSPGGEPVPRLREGWGEVFKSRERDGRYVASRQGMGTITCNGISSFQKKSVDFDCPLISYKILIDTIPYDLLIRRISRVLGEISINVQVNLVLRNRP